MKLIILIGLVLATHAFAANTRRNENHVLHYAVTFTTSTAATDLNWGQTDVDAASLWNQGIKGAGVKIGLVASAINFQHPQLKSSIAINTVEAQGKPGIDDDQNGYVDDIYGWNFAQQDPQYFSEQATHIAGILVADPSTGDIQGMAPEAKIIPSGFLNELGGSISDAVLAIEYAIQRGARVVNMSWGGAPYSQALYDVIYKHPDVLFVTAAGNDSLDIDITPDYPASFNLPNLITVGATNSYDNYIYWSNYGWKSVDLAAPGENIISTGIRNDYRSMDGTSIAAPFVTGAAALLWSYAPTATVLQIRQAILDGVEVGPYRVYSGGRLNVGKALASLKTKIAK